MHVNYFNLHKSIINNCLSEELQNYSVLFITHLWVKLHPQSLIKYVFDNINVYCILKVRVNMNTIINEICLLLCWHNNTHNYT
jgi:hypothetical protein